MERRIQKWSSQRTVSLINHSFLQTFYLNPCFSVFPDVPRVFQETSAAGVKLYIYSSGSVAAQKLLFGSSTHGDLLQFLNGHFDLDVGFKQDESSYVNILRNLGIEGKDAVFFTDIVKG